MHPYFLLLAAGIGADSESIVITASREPQAMAAAPASVSLLDADTLDRLGLPLAGDALRLMPGISVSVSGPAGSQTQLRIRGAEATHSLLFVDGIRFNDPAAGNEARFELLGTDGLAQIELIRGPQSALWGSEALGGVVAVESPSANQGDVFSARAEYGSHSSQRLAGEGAARIGSLGISGGARWLRSDGIDAFGSGGERDGFENRSASLEAVYTATAAAEFGVVGHWLDAKSQYDGFDPITFQHADTRDTTRNQIAAGRLWTSLGLGADHDWSLTLDASHLRSSNRNALDGTPLNSTFGRRTTFGAQLARDLVLGGTRHRLILAAEHQREQFRSRDQQYFGATDQDRSRTLSAVVAEWRGDWLPALSTDLALRHDRFSGFADTTTLRGSVLVRPARHWTLHAAYGQGIAQPSFYDLFGFFPGSFVGNPDLRPESGTSWEAGARWVKGGTSLGFTAFTARLADEIVDIFDPQTFLSSTANVEGKSRRRGVEVEAAQTIGSKLSLSFNYSYLDADERCTPGTAPIREIRRARHSANLFGTAMLGSVTLGAALAYVGKRTDTDFDVFPARAVTLPDYLLASATLGWTIADRWEVYGRVENGFGADYEDAIGYATAGRTVYAGLRLRLGD